MNSTSKPGSRISSSILMTSSSWQTARHRIGVPTDHYTRRGRRVDRRCVQHGCACHQSLDAVARARTSAGCSASGLLPRILRARRSSRSPVFQWRGRPRQPGRHRHRQARAISSPTSSADDFEVFEDGRRRRSAILPATRGEPGPRDAPRPAARRQREHGRGHRVHADRRDQVPEHADRRASTSRSSTSTPRCASRVTAERVRPR